MTHTPPVNRGTYLAVVRLERGVVVNATQSAVQRSAGVGNQRSDDHLLQQMDAAAIALETVCITDRAAKCAGRSIQGKCQPSGDVAGRLNTDCSAFCPATGHCCH